MDSLKGGQHRKIYNEPYMPLTIEKIGQHLETPWGIGDQYSLCHYYEQNGHLMQDPEMCFFVIDKREGFSADYGKAVIAPYMFQQANLGIYQESVRMENQKVTVFHRRLQNDHTQFANQWLLNIMQQGFLLK